MERNFTSCHLSRLSFISQSSFTKSGATVYSYRYLTLFIRQGTHVKKDFHGEIFRLMMKAHLKVKVIIRCALKEESREGEEDILLLTRFVCLLNIWKQDQGMHSAHHNDAL